MCPPQWYGVDYVCHQSLDGEATCISRPGTRPSRNGKSYTSRCRAAWPTMRLLHPEAGCPDMTFSLATEAVIRMASPRSRASITATAAVWETPFLRTWMEERHGFLVWNTPRETAFEGEGDVLVQCGRHRVMGRCMVSRTCRSSHRHVADALACAGAFAAPGRPAVPITWIHALRRWLADI